MPTITAQCDICKKLYHGNNRLKEAQKCEQKHNRFMALVEDSRKKMLLLKFVDGSPTEKGILVLTKKVTCQYNVAEKQWRIMIEYVKLFDEKKGEVEDCSITGEFFYRGTEDVLAEVIQSKVKLYVVGEYKNALKFKDKKKIKELVDRLRKTAAAALEAVELIENNTAGT